MCHNGESTKNYIGPRRADKVEQAHCQRAYMHNVCTCQSKLHQQMEFHILFPKSNLKHMMKPKTTDAKIKKNIYNSNHFM